MITQTERYLGQLIVKERWIDVWKLLQTENGRSAARNGVYGVQQFALTTRGYTLDPLPGSGNFYGQQATALHLACLFDPPENIVTLLLDASGPGAILRLAQPCGETPLHFAVRGSVYARYQYNQESRRNQKSQHGLIRLLLEKRSCAAAEQSSAEYGALTPLHLACYKGAPSKVISMLVKAHPRGVYDIKTKRGNTALDIINNTPFRAGWKRKLASSLLHVVDDWMQNEEARTRGVPSKPDKSNAKVHPKGDTDQPGVDAGLCILCWDGQADHALVPCGHVCLCKRCAESYAPIRGKCPVCKSRTDQTMKIFLTGIPNT